MALVSPGLEITVTDESQYVPGAVGTVPLIIMATAQDKLNPAGSSATDTSVSRAGKLLVYNSQRELITSMGYPEFKQSAAGTPLHGDERNEYGLMTAYSLLGTVNRIYAIRANINLDDLEPTAVRPIGAVTNGTYWMDLAESVWGINEWDAINSEFTLKTPILLTSTTNQTLTGGIYVPNSSVGQIGNYAVSFGTGSNAVLFYKNRSNNWVRIGTDDWAESWPTLKGTVTFATSSTNAVAQSTPAASLVINGTTIVVGNTGSARTIAQVVSAINGGAPTGVSAAYIGGKLEIYATDDAASDGVTADGKITISNGSGTAMAQLGLGASGSTYANPKLTFGTFVEIPNWRSSDSVPRPTGSIFMKVGATGNGADIAIKRYNSTTAEFATVAAPMYNTLEKAIYGLDPAGGGAGIAANTLFVKWDSLLDGSNAIKPFRRRSSGATTVSGSIIGASPFTVSDEFIISVTQIGTSNLGSYNIILSGTSQASFVSTVSAANIPELEISLENNVITFRHIYGGDIYLNDVTGTPTADAGFTSSTSGTVLFGSTLALTNWTPLTYTYSTTEPYQSPADGTLWYYSDAAAVDIMINEIGGWKSYHSSYYDGSTTDARGFDLSLTDPEGVIVSASEPEYQSDGVTGLAAGDLWLDTGDLENYPALYRYNGSEWQAIDNTDQVSQNGILFADARWDTDGTTDIVAGSLPAITDLLVSDYIDQDAPDYRLYPRGMLLFNTRRSGYNVKQFVSNKFNANDYPDLPTVPGAGGSLPTVKNTWQTASGLKDNGSPYMGRQAQRKMVVAAMQSALIASTQIREDQFQFNIIAAPGYPELIDEMVSLNNDRAQTAFVVGDTPMRLAPNAVDIANWSNNSNGDGLATASPYLAVYYPSGQASDLQGNSIVVPPSHMALRTMVFNDNVSYQWFAPAGTRRGLVDNATNIGYIDSITGEFTFDGVRQGLRDTLYENKINPITNIPGVGLVVWGQKTRNPTASSLDRINVARLVNYIRTILATIGNGFFFEPNDKITRDQIKNIINGAINDLVAKRGIYDYIVVCDETNNTPTRIARNELYVDIAIEPVKAVEFIYIPIRLKNPGDIAAGV